MSERDPREGSVEQGLPRLPPGRHGLARDFVVKNQRDRLTAGTISVIAERGYHDATVTQICAAAGVSRRTFYSYFSSKEECYLATFDLVVEYVVETMGEAPAKEDEWPEQARARIASMLATFAENPDLVRFVLVAPMRAGEGIAARHRVALERVLEELSRGEPKRKGGRTASAAVGQALIGGIVGLIVRQVERGDGSSLGDLLPDLVEIFLTPYIGREEAARCAYSET